MENKNMPAFPTTVVGKIEGEPQNWQEGGLTKREYFASVAPAEIPAWFNPKPAGTKPSQPMQWQEMEEGKDREACMDWHRDQSYDLPEHLQWYQQAWHKYYEDSGAYDMNNFKARYFAWRVYYADELLKRFDQ